MILLIYVILICLYGSSSTDSPEKSGAKPQIHNYFWYNIKNTQFQCSSDNLCANVVESDVEDTIHESSILSPASSFYSGVHMLKSQSWGSDSSYDNDEHRCGGLISPV